MPTLYLVPNTLGLLDSASIAATLPPSVQKTIAGLPHFIAENAKTARAFLKALNSCTPLTYPLQQISMDELNINTKNQQLTALLAPVQRGLDIGLISEAGVPAVADPGANLVRLAHQQGIRVLPLVGPSSILLALMASGLNGQRFAFHGYLPQNQQEREHSLRILENESQRQQQTQIFIETPYRNLAMLKTLLLVCKPNTRLCTATDLTLVSESIISQPISAWQHFNPQLIDAMHKRPTVFLLLAEVIKRPKNTKS